MKKQIMLSEEMAIQQNVSIESLVSTKVVQGYKIINQYVHPAVGQVVEMQLESDALDTFPPLAIAAGDMTAIFTSIVKLAALLTRNDLAANRHILTQLNSSYTKLLEFYSCAKFYEVNVPSAQHCEDTYQLLIKTFVEDYKTVIMTLAGFEKLYLPAELQERINKNTNAYDIVESL